MSNIYNLDILRDEEVCAAVDRNIECDPAVVALKRGVPSPQVVATQVKYLQRARRKLPTLYASRCVIPPRAFEQSSSEESAERKPLNGESCLDLTCGLGIDSMALARRFRRVVALERDTDLAEVVRHNMALMGIDNVEVVSSSAEEYVASCSEQFDWVFVDPDRRSEAGNKMVCMEDCSPNILELMPRLRELSRRVAIKLSPMFDCAEAFRLLSPAEVEVVSIAGECKELNIYTGAERNILRIAVIGQGEWEFSEKDMTTTPSRVAFECGDWRYLHLPDVALQKARVAIAAFRGRAEMWSNNGFAFSREMLDVALPCRSYEIVSVERYHPKELKRRYRGVGLDIIKRDTQLSVDAVRKALGARSGSEVVVALTSIESETYIIEIKPITK
ncbi:MAG: RsmD family RNA methyltransferase [Alistipes sp.]|nr:RsmD family RNA methyltransferase [Alistipes sp.]